MTDAALPTGTTTARRDWRPVIVLVAAFAVFTVGQRIPLPGLDGEAIALQISDSADVLARVSILATGIVPLLTALACGQLAQLLVPPLARWQAAAPSNARSVRLAVVLLALGLTVLQGRGLLLAIAQIGLVAPGTGWFAPVGLACFLAGTALFVWLAERGWPLGIWLLLAVAYLAAVPAEVSTWIELGRIGALTPADWLLPVLYLAGGAILVAFTHAALLRALAADENGQAAAVTVLLWPPFLTSLAGGLLLGPLLLVVPRFGESAEGLLAVRMLVVLALVPAFVALYARLYVRLRPAADAKAIAPAFGLAALVQVALCLGGEWLAFVAAGPISLWGAPLIAVVTVMLVIGRSLGLRSLLGAPEHGGRPKG